jgi:hypothetical protein
MVCWRSYFADFDDCGEKICFEEFWGDYETGELKLFD